MAANKNALLSAVERQQSMTAGEDFLSTMAAAYTKYTSAKDNEIELLKDALKEKDKQIAFLQKLLRDNGIAIPQGQQTEQSAAPQPSPKPKRLPSFRDLIQTPDPDATLLMLHQRIDGKGGKDVAMILLKALEEKMIYKLPSKKVFFSEFESVTTSWNAISYYLNDNNPVDVTSIVLT